MARAVGDRHSLDRVCVGTPRWLAVHSRGGTEERGVSLTVRKLATDRGRGLSLSLAPHWGAGTGGADALWREELPKGTGAGADAPGRLESEIGYGMAMFGDRFTGTPNLGFRLSEGGRDYRVGWRLTPAVPGDTGFEINLDATRSESANDNEPAGHGATLNVTVHF